MQVFTLDQQLVDEKEKVHARNLHGWDADGLKKIRDHHFPNGELDDGGGAIPPIAAGLLACPGTAWPPGTSDPEDFASVDAVSDGMPVTVLQAEMREASGQKNAPGRHFAEYLEEHCPVRCQ